MENFKKNIWEKEQLDIKYFTLDCSDVERVMHDIETRHDIVVSFNASFFVDISKVLKKELIMTDINEPVGFKYLISSLNLNIPSDNIVNIIWNYNEVDQFKCGTLQKYWEYIWYGASDEMCVLHFPNTQLLLMITDYGTIYKSTI